MARGRPSNDEASGRAWGGEGDDDDDDADADGSGGGNHGDGGDGAGSGGGGDGDGSAGGGAVNVAVGDDCSGVCQPEMSGLTCAMCGGEGPSLYSSVDVEEVESTRQVDSPAPAM